jgi:hypothetical protein
LNDPVEWPETPDRKTAVAMIGAMLGAFGAKADPVVMAGMLDMIESEELGIATGLCQPMHLSAESLAIACRTLIANNKFIPKPAELHEACREAYRKLAAAFKTAEDLVMFVRRCDALLLEFAHDEWERPYLLSKYRQVLESMLELHSIYGNGTKEFAAWEQEWERGKEIHPFLALVRAEKAKLALPAPSAEPAKPRIAACGATDRMAGVVKSKKTTSKRSNP